MITDKHRETNLLGLEIMTTALAPKFTTLVGLVPELAELKRLGDECESNDDPTGANTCDTMIDTSVTAFILYECGRMVIRENNGDIRAKRTTATAIKQVLGKGYRLNGFNLSA